MKEHFQLGRDWVTFHGKRDRNKRGFARNECVRTEHVHQRERKNFPRGSARNPSALNWSTRVSPSHDDARTVERAKLID